ncbi:hypothetical protein C8258_08935 [Nocardia sp. MDA0666]|uniref:hypothetical protein n=1 Tax=Nocardia sp. MDA0666 TaxID=2135448 RepID=UPI000D13E722|nr:hypothetical protein [Nocardia sp. MDA0666]PSR68621.1 hypothetical protein C8258_08935 [Nocardia sp. MDA0666]
MTDIASLAASTRAVFGDPGVHAVVRAGRTVHVVVLGQWVGDEQAPELLCHTGTAGWSRPVLEATRADVTGARCLRKLGSPHPPHQRRLHLFGDGGTVDSRVFPALFADRMIGGKVP